ncbi:MAG: AraC family transcriptional regulator, partial [Clostridia bacterium]|nr:AraC family transcriptional regulator [Clostridia bacterium]
PGLTLLLTSDECPSAMRIPFEIDCAPVSLCCNLTQDMRIILDRGPGRTVLERPPGHCLLSCLPETRGVTDISPGPVRGVSVHFSLPTFQELFGTTNPALTDSHIPGCASGSPCRLLRQSVMTSPSRQIVEQILSCPFRNALRRVYLEAKALELAALHLAELEPHPTTNPALSSREVEMVRAAHALLLARLDGSLGLEDLARAVGLNRNKLNHGFRQLYGATAFTLLRDARLDRARDLLRQTETNLSEIALAVGYNSQANFTTAYRRRFGHTPAAMRRREAGRMVAAEW